MGNDDRDAFTDHVLNNIDFKDYRSLSSEQLSAITDAVSARKPEKKHAVSVRGTINLFFAKFYFVFFMGRDRRISTEAIEEERREKVSLFGNLIYLMIVFLSLTLFAIYVLYGLKNILGIDLIPSIHMGWILGL
jgi:hypothetical protein